MLFVKVIVLLLLGFVVVSLFSGLFFLVKDKGQTNRTVNALSVRIGLSILAIVIVMIAGATGVIELNPSPLSDGSATSSESAEGGNASSTDQSAEPSSSGRRRVDPASE